MPVATNHTVNKLSLQLHGVTVNKVFDVRQQLANQLEHYFPAALNEMLDTHFDTAAHVYIDKIVVQVKAPHEFNVQQLQALIMHGLEQAIKKKREEIQVPDAETELPGTNGGTALQDSLLPFKAWIWWLQHGSLPWWYSPQSQQQWQAMLLVSIQQSNTTATHIFFRAWQQPVVRLRLVSQASDSFKTQVLAFFFLQTEHNLSTQIESFKAIYTTLCLNESIPATIFLDPVTIDSAAWIWLTETLATHNRISYILAAQKLYSLHILQSKNYLQPVQKLLALFQQSLANASDSNDEHMQNEQLQSIKDAAPQQLAINDALLVYNAGVVLLHPFIVNFFTALQVLDNDKQIIEPCRAISLLATLCGDGTTVAEYETPLLKLLCGITDEAFVFLPAPITIADLEECKSLLQSVIQHWSALRSTSAVGLQETFLKRMGKLIFKKDHYELQVEMHGTDVLLGSLPWGLSMIKLPWMKTYLTVDWTNG